MATPDARPPDSPPPVRTDDSPAPSSQEPTEEPTEEPSSEAAEADDRPLPEDPEPPTHPRPPVGPPSQPSAGWYSDGSELRWWDGQAWGPVAPRQVDSNDENLATLAHLGFVAGGFILPLGLYAWADDERRPATRHHAREALNFQLTLLTVQFGLLALVFLMVIGFALFGPEADPGDSGLAFAAGVGLFFVLIPLVFVVAIGSMVFSVIAAIRANRGERYRYPLCIRFVRS
ncbi:MAG: DUF4870 domain-containing protein [Ilumatobacter sp.]